MNKSPLGITIGAAIIIFCLGSCVQEHSCECDFTDQSGQTQTENYSYDGDPNEAAGYCETREDDLDDIYSDASCSVR
jgi:hypothetical protein